ncbi:MAG TPA: NUDIX domain-containing protein [Terriglobia bacterium]|nr:NUDIX domain-containing protein [Terriglobia bacterium]
MVETIPMSVQRLAGSTKDTNSLMAETVKHLQRERPHYNWVGIYLLEKDVLVLGPFMGRPTPHTRIPLNKGICGAAASTGHTVIVDDVKADPRYLACSMETSSEIVVPIVHEGQVLGEIDIDSDIPAAFSEEDRSLLEQVAEILAQKLHIEKTDTKPILVAAGILKDGDRVLICQRHHSDAYGMQWEFPGGKVETNEDVKESLRRELSEELSIDATVGDEVFRLRHRYPDRYVEVVFFSVPSYQGTISNRVFEAIEWVPLVRLPFYEFLEADRKLVNRMARGEIV